MHISTVFMSMLYRVHRIVSTGMGSVSATMSSVCFHGSSLQLLLLPAVEKGGVFHPGGVLHGAAHRAGQRSLLHALQQSRMA